MNARDSTCVKQHNKANFNAVHQSFVEQIIKKEGSEMPLQKQKTKIIFIKKFVPLMSAEDIAC